MDEKEDLSLSMARLVTANLTVVLGWLMLILSSLQLQVVFGINILYHFWLLLFEMPDKFSEVFLMCRREGPI